MATEPGSAWELCAAAGEALAEAGFRTGEFTSPGELFARARARAERDGDRKAEATAVGGLGMTVHYRTIARLVSDLPPDGADVAEEEAPRWPPRGSSLSPLPRSRWSPVPCPPAPRT